MREYKIIEFSPENEQDKITGMTINSSLEDVMYFIHSLQEEMLLDNPDFLKLKSLCFELVCRLPLPVQLLQDTFILRGRENINGEVFSRISDLSYNPKQDKIGLGRFNLSGEPVFYGAVPITTHNASGQLTTICESCKELFDTNSVCDCKYFTIGKWNIVKPITTVVLTFFENAEEKSWHVGNLNPHYVKFISGMCNEEDREKCRQFYSFFSNAAAKKQVAGNSYLLTTAFFHALQEYYGEELGILYSSSMTDNTGLNLALSKGVLDNNYLSLEAAVMFKAMRDKKNFKSFTLFPCTDCASVTRDDRFRFSYIL